MNDSTHRQSDFELLIIPQEVLGKTEVDEIHEVRRIWVAAEQMWYYSIVDVVRFLTTSKNAAAYWSTLKKRDKSLEETLAKIKALPLRAKDGRLREAECVSRETMFRIIQSIPSPAPLVEAAKLWLAQLAEEKIQHMEIQTQAEHLRAYYIQQRGRTPAWAEARIRNLIGRNALTDEWLARGAQQNLHFGILTNTIHRGTFGITTAEHHHHIKLLPKGIKNPRDHYTEAELGVLTLAELAARQRHEEMESQGYAEMPKLQENSESKSDWDLKRLLGSQWFLRRISSSRQKARKNGLHRQGRKHCLITQAMSKLQMISCSKRLICCKGKGAQGIQEAYLRARAIR